MTNQDWILLISSVVQVIAVLTAPLIALWVNQKLRDGKERKERKEFVFRTLMSTRATGLAQNHVQALNMIDVEFYGDNRKDKDVIEAWKTYHNFLSTPMSNQELWGQKREELLLDLLYKMATNLGYDDLSKTTIKGTSYFPTGHGDMENDQVTIRKGFAQIFEGNRAFPVEVYEAPKHTINNATDK